MTARRLKEIHTYKSGIALFPISAWSTPVHGISSSSFSRPSEVLLTRNENHGGLGEKKVDCLTCKKEKKSAGQQREEKVWTSGPKMKS